MSCSSISASIAPCNATQIHWRSIASHALRSHPSVAIIIGANTGSVSTDPSFRWLAASRFHGVQKVFVEPIASLHRQLESNIANMANATAVNAAVTSGTRPVDMYCMSEDETIKAPAWWSQICSLSRDRLFSDYDVARGGGVDKASIAARIRTTRVPGLTIDDLLRKYVHSPLSSIEYVQIDVEGFDDHVLEYLPFADSRFGPATIAFEWVLLPDGRRKRATDKLRDRGYELCCDFQNIVAVRRNLVSSGKKLDDG